ncbi:MAG: ABC transporter permease [Acidobacteria bacterium]|nr:ABC transporter permease [Acidobacteriota bacterium]
MNKMFLVIKREYLERVLSKWFLIGTLLGPVLMAVLILAPLLVTKLDTSDRKVTVLSLNNDTALLDSIEKRLGNKKDPLGKGKYVVKTLAIEDPSSLPKVQEDLAKQIKSGDINGYLVIKEEGKEHSAEFFAENVSDLGTIRRLEDATSDAIVEKRLSLEGMDIKKINELSKPIDIKTKKLVDAGTKEDNGQSMFLGLIMMFILYMTMLIYGMTVLRGVVEEKQSRIIEVVISSISPLQLMFGKILGIGLVGLTQFTVWSIFGAILPTILASFSLASGMMSIPDIPKSLLVYFVLYFVLGYFLFATLFALAGSIVSNEQDAQQVQMPITMLLIIATIFTTLIIRDPNGTTSIALSLVPFFGPILMFLRIAVQTPPFWQIALSLSLMVVTIIACSWLAAKIYRVGILMYGKRPNIPELIKWLKYT